MKETRSLRLLVVDEEQLLAEKIVSLLQKQNISCSMVLVDEKSELVKALRRRWDIALYGKTYDLGIDELLNQIKALEIDLPVVAMQEYANDVVSSHDHSDKNAMHMLESGVTEVHLRTHVSRIARAIRSQLAHLNFRRKLRGIQNTLAETEMRATLLLKNSRSAVAYISEGMHIYVNQAYQALFGYEMPEDLIGVPVIDLIAGKNVTEFKEFLTAFMKGDRSNLEFVFDSVRPDGSTFEAKLQLAAASHEGEPCTQIIIQQHSQASEEVKAQLAAAERTDGLTGLGNRRAFEEDLKKARSLAINKHAKHALMYVNVDNIGQISASMGIEGTDATIIHISNRLKEVFPEGSINRFSDSGFTVIEYDANKETLVNKVEEMRLNIADDLIDVQSRSATTTISVGIVMITEAAPDTNELFQRAYSAIDKVRKSTKGVGNGVHLYDPYANAAESKTAMFETVNNALDRNMFKLLFQPIYSVADDTSNFFEVYLRLPLPDGNEISPDKFLDIAEQCNMLERLDRWVMLNATKALRKELKNDPKARLLINLSSSAIQDKGLPEFAAKLNQAIGATHNPLTLQFNEHDVTNYLGAAKEQFAAFRAAGCQISINSFGASMKSLDMFIHVQPAIVKLDRTYAQNLGDSENLEATQSFVNEIKEKGVNTLMAFIEDAATMSAAWRVGAPYLQGIYLQSPSESLVSNNAS